MNNFKENSWSYLNRNANKRSSASWEIFGGTSTVLFMGVVMLLWVVLLSGCSTVQRFAEQSKAAEEAIEQGEDLFRAGENFADQAGETGKAAKRLAPNRTCIEAKDASAQYDVRARLVGTDQRYLLSPTEFKRWERISWLADRHAFTIEMEVFQNGEYIRTTAQRIENEFSRYELSKDGCGILYFTSDGERIEGLQKPSEMEM
jgi:Tfp pilus assembly protein PilX